MTIHGNGKYAEPKTPEQKLSVLFDYAGRIANQKRVDALLMLMADMGRELVQSDRCTVWLWDRERRELWSKVAHGVSELRIPENTGIVGHCVSTGETVLINDAHNDPRHNRDVDLRTGYTTRNLLTIPVRNNDGQIIGAYQAINKMSGDGSFSQQDITELDLAAAYSGKSLENAILYEEIEATQREVVCLMGEVGESRSKETGNHVKRVAEYSYILAKACGLSDEEADLLKVASPMHDIGKVAIPDAILKKPGKLTDEEFDHMKQHCDIGYHILCHSSRRIIQAASVVAYQHHEKYNGRGYPRGISGQDIHIFGRITAVADVFDALGSDRCYKKAWELERILTLFREERGQHFCPDVVDAFFLQLDSLLKVRDQYTDDPDAPCAFPGE